MKIGCLFSRKSRSVCFSFSVGAYRVRYRSQRDAPTNVLLMTCTRSFLLPPQKSNIKHIQKNSLIIIFSKEFKRWQSLFSIGFVIIVTIKSLTGQHWRCLVVFWEYELMLETDATLDTAAKHSEQTVCVCQRSPQTLQNYYIVWFSKKYFLHIGTNLFSLWS